MTHWHECDECAGTGRIVTPYRNSGEAFGGWNETRCDNCDGDGGWEGEPICEMCEKEMPQGVCLDCMSPDELAAFTAPAIDIAPDTGWPRIAA